MRYICSILLISILLASCTFTSKTHEEEVSHESKNVVIPASILVTSKDYACGMTLHDGSIADTTTYNQKVYGFCSSECKAEFLKSPEAMLKK